MKVKIAMISSALLVSLLSSGCSFIFPLEEETLKPPIVKPSEVKYTTTTITKGPIESNYEASAFVASSQTYNLMFENASGFLTYINNTPGANVKKGDVLAELDTSSLKKSLQSAQMSLERSKLLRSNIDSVSDPAETHQIDVQISEINIEKQRLDLKTLEEQTIREYNSYEIDLARAGASNTYMQYAFLNEQMRLLIEEIKEKEALIKQLELETPPNTVLIKQEKSALEALKKERKSLGISVSSAKTQSAQSDLNVESLEKDFEYKESTHERDVEIARLNLKKSEMEHAKLAAGKQSASGIEIKLADLDVKQQELEVSRISGELEKATLRSPIDGEITNSELFAIGDSISATTVIATIADTANVLLVTSDTDARVKDNGDAIVNYKGKEYKAKIKKIGTLASEEQKAKGKVPYTFLFELEDFKGKLEYGESVTFKIVFDKKENVMQVPNICLTIISDNDKTATVPVLEDGIRVETSVIYGIQGVNSTEIVSGLTGKEEIIIR